MDPLEPRGRRAGEISEKGLFRSRNDSDRAASLEMLQNASRRLRRSKAEDFPLLKTLKYTGDPVEHIERILREFCNFRRVMVTKNNEWKRRLLIYART